MTTVRLPGKQNKYRAKPAEVEGVRFASQREAKRFWELRLLEKAGQIYALARQVPISIDIWAPHAGKYIQVCKYIADFCYVENGRTIYEDAKGVRTKEYKLKKKLVWACHGIDIKET